MEVTAENFQSLLDKYDALLLNFHAPWCPHCQRFAPVWEHASEMVNDRLFGPEKRRDYALRLGMGAVDCTTQLNIPLCRDQHIQAFPTVRVYRRVGSAGCRPKPVHCAFCPEAHSGSPLPSCARHARARQSARVQVAT